MVNRIILLFTFSFAVFICPTNANDSKIDSLWSEFSNAIDNTHKIDILFAIGDLYRESSPDSLLLYYNEAIDLATRTGLETLGYLNKTGDELISIATELRKKAQFNMAMGMLEQAIDIFEKTEDKNGLARCYQNLGNIYFSIADFEKALDNYMLALELFEKESNSIGIAGCFNNIGTIHKEQKSFDIALSYHNKSKHLFLKLLETIEPVRIRDVKQGLSFTYNNIGIVYFEQDEFEDALDYYHKSLRIKEELDDKNGIAQSINNIAIVYCTKGNLEKGIEQFEKSLVIYQKVGNRNGLAMVNSNIAYLHLILADNAENEKERSVHLQKAIHYANSSYEIANDIEALTWINQSAHHLMNAYNSLGHFKKAIEFAKKYIETQNEISSTEKAKALAEVTTKYEAEKKQLQIENLSQEKERFKQRLSEQNVIIILAMALLFILLGFVVTLLRYFNQKKQANIVLAERNEEITQQKEEIIAQLEELGDQRDKLEASKSEIEKLYNLALEQKQILEVQKTKIDDSIHYANFIQTALLPDLDATLVSRSWGVNSYFVMFRPKDVVSGDFYWATRIGDRIIVAVVDCTGHGVPGAFMSMLGISFLNEIVLTADVIEPAIILSKLRSYIISSLKQSDSMGSQRDGMDMSIISLNTQTKECQWAGANNPLWIVRSNEMKTGKDFDPQVEEIRANPMPVAIHYHMDEFLNHNIKLKSGDRIFLFSDGYSDQFGGPYGKKFNMHKAFKNLIAKTSIHPMREQGRVLEETFDKWVGGYGKVYEQIDDVTVIGIMI